MPQSRKRKTPQSTEPPATRRKAAPAPEPKLNLVPDDIDDATHARLDQQIFSLIESIDLNTIFSAASLLHLIVKYSADVLDPRYKEISDDVELLRATPELVEMLKAAWANKSCREIRRLEILRLKSQPAQSVSTAHLHHQVNQRKAVEQSWERPFVGTSAAALWDHIQRHFNTPISDRVYAHYAAIVQSSGMGKSRMVDELSKTVFAIPINLREPISTGYPPADHEARDFLTANYSQNYVYLRMCAFMEALFDHAAEIIQNGLSGVTLEDLAMEFRRKMTEGQTFQSVNSFRQKFYHQVVQKAEAKFTAVKEHFKSPNDKPIHDSPSRKNENPNFSVTNACDEFVALLRGEHQGSPSPGAIADKGPHILLSLDEAHTMTLEKTVQDTQMFWSNWTELRHVLRGLHDCSIFTLAMSTTGKISLFTPASGNDYSQRVYLRDLVLIQPFTLVGFDALAKKVSLDHNLTLEDVTSDSHIVHLGRPMFAALWDAATDTTVRKNIISLAISKLVNPNRKPKLDEHQQLACLSQRVPIEFNSMTYISQAKERQQVEGHMRVCLKIDATFESMVTLSASEPLLSEAAYAVMSDPSFDVPKAMTLVIDGFAINKGDHGEFVVMLLFTVARDKSVGPPGNHGSPKSRIIPLHHFLSHSLFRNPPGLLSLAMDFADSYMYFNHYIKVHEFNGIDAESLLLLSTRGAAVLCTNNQQAVDGINPFLYKGTEIRYDNLGLILWQSKNNAEYTHSPNNALFTAMDPYQLGILKKPDKPVPLIKIVFALAAKTPSLNFVRRPPSDAYNAVVYEIWCAGISQKILGPVETAQEPTWAALVQASYGWKAIYKGTNVEQSLMRSMNPGAACDLNHWDAWSLRRSI